MLRFVYCYGCTVIRGGGGGDGRAPLHLARSDASNVIGRTGLLNGARESETVSRFESHGCKSCYGDNERGNFKAIRVPRDCESRSNDNGERVNTEQWPCFESRACSKDNGPRVNSKPISRFGGP